MEINIKNFYDENSMKYVGFNKQMVNAEIYKADPNENLFIQSRGMSPNPNEMPWPDPSEKDVVYLAWSNYTKGYAAGWAAAKAEDSKWNST
jgi:hypothetical protein